MKILEKDQKKERARGEYNITERAVHSFLRNCDNGLQKNTFEKGEIYVLSARIDGFTVKCYAR